MTKNKSKYTVTFLLATCLLLQGCSPNEEQLWGLGSFVFLAFAIILILNGVAPRIQEIPNIQTLIAKLEHFSEKVLPIILIMATASLVYGAYSIVSNDDRSRQDLFVFVGAVILFLAANLRGWARTKEIMKKRNHLRMIGLSLSFLAIFCYLLLGAPNLNL